MNAKRLVCLLVNHSWMNLCPPSVTPFVTCRRCHKSGWVLW